MMSDNPRTKPHIPFPNGRCISKERFDDPLVRVYWYEDGKHDNNSINWQEVKGAVHIRSLNAPRGTIDIVKFDCGENLTLASLRFPELTRDAKERAWNFFSVDISKGLVEAMEFHERHLKILRDNLDQWATDPDLVLERFDKEIKKSSKGPFQTSTKLKKMLQNLKAFLPYEHNIRRYFNEP